MLFTDISEWPSVVTFFPPVLECFLSCLFPCLDLNEGNRSVVHSALQILFVVCEHPKYICSIPQTLIDEKSAPRNQFLHTHKLFICINYCDNT